MTNIRAEQTLRQHDSYPPSMDGGDSRGRSGLTALPPVCIKLTYYRLASRGRCRRLGSCSDDQPAVHVQSLPGNICSTRRDQERHRGGYVGLFLTGGEAHRSLAPPVQAFRENGVKACDGPVLGGATREADPRSDARAGRLLLESHLLRTAGRQCSGPRQIDDFGSEEHIDQHASDRSAVLETSAG